MIDSRLTRFKVKDYKTFSVQVSIFRDGDNLSVLLYMYDKKSDIYYLRNFYDEVSVANYLEDKIEKDKR